MPGADWFPGARLNYAQHVLRHERPGQDALYFQSETTPLTGLPWPACANQVRVLATRLRAMDVRPRRAGRRVPVRAGAVWSSAVDLVFLRHHRAAQGDRAQSRRHPHRTAEAADRAFAEYARTQRDYRPADSSGRPRAG